jgi:hypothetical protein
MSPEGLSVEWDDYLVVLREDAHQLLAWGYVDTRRALSMARDEYDMTGLIADAIDRRINDPQTPERFTVYSVHNERPTSPDAELGKDRPRLDIQIERCAARPKRCFTFEAKRLRDDALSSMADTLLHYLGEKGVGRFVAARYAPESVEAAMVGCIQTYDARFWFDRIGEAFIHDRASGQDVFCLIDQLRWNRVISDLPDEAVSSHKRAGRGPIHLFHIFIDCS